VTPAQGGTPKDSKKRKGLKDPNPPFVKKPSKRVAGWDTAQEGKENEKDVVKKLLHSYPKCVMIDTQ